MHRDQAGASSSHLAICVIIEGVERFFWFWWFQTLAARTGIAPGYLLLPTYLLPMLLAPFVARLGTGRCVGVGSCLYGLAFAVSAFLPAEGVWLVVVASAVHKTALIPTASQSDSIRSYPALIVAVNVAGGLSALLYGSLQASPGLRATDSAAVLAFGFCSLLAFRLRRIAPEQRREAKGGSMPLLTWRAVVQLPLYVAYWAYMTAHRRELEPLFVSAGLPKGSLLAVLCVAVLAYGLILTRKSSEGWLRNGNAVLLTSSVVWFYFYAVAGLTLRWWGHVGAAHPKLFSLLLLAQAGVGFAAAEAISGAVCSRLLVEAAPSRPIGSAAYFAVLGLGSLLSKFLCDRFSGDSLLLVLALVALVPSVLSKFGGAGPSPTAGGREPAANLGGSHG
jgi:hypothetical protein